jgi:hypothetical protein
MNLKKILRSARIISWSYRVLSTVVGLVTVRLINERIGMSGYGDVAFMLAFMGGICSIDLGFLQSISRFVSKSSNPSQGQQRGYFWASCALFLIGLCFFQMVLVVAVSFALGSLDELRSFSLVEVVALAATMMIGNLLSTGSAIYAGWQQYGLAGIAKIARSFGYLGAIVALWWLGDISVRSVLWSGVLAALLPNMIVGIALLARHKNELRPNWENFPSDHLKQLQSMASYSLHGWLFTASTVLITSGAIFVAGLIFPAESVAKLQIALVLYTGVAAFVTGGMAPLTTIRARFADATTDSIDKVAKAAHRLVEEGVVLTAILLGFFVHHLDIVLELLLGKQAQDPQLLSLTWQLVNVVLVPGLMILPWFTFRFALVQHDENARYSKQLFIVTCLALLIGSLVGFMMSNPLPIAISIAIALIYRGVLAYQLGHYVLPGLRRFSIVFPLSITFVLCTLLNSFAMLFQPGWHLGELKDNHLHAFLYLLFCASLYLLRGRLHPLIGLRVPGTSYINRKS